MEKGQAAAVASARLRLWVRVRDAVTISSPPAMLSAYLPAMLSTYHPAIAFLSLQRRVGEGEFKMSLQ